MSALPLAVILQLAGSSQCSAPGLQPYLLTALVQQESGGDPLVLGDDVRHVPIHPATAEDAERITLQRWHAGMSTGLGLTQLTASSEREFIQKFAITAREAFDPCVNLRTGGRFLLFRALQVYNSGSPTGAPVYASSVENRMTALGRSTVPAAAAEPSSTTPPPPPCAPRWDAWALAACSARRPLPERAPSPAEGVASASVVTASEGTQ